MVIICQCQNARLVSEATRRQVSDALKSTSQPVVYVDDLCALAAKKNPLLGQWAEQKELVVCACFPRAVKALFSHAKVNLPESTKIFNLRTQQPEDILSLLPVELDDKGQTPPKTIQATDPDWVPWFPVIDYQRCKNCKQCLNFCLFGVYSMTQDQTVQVSLPAKCKTGCPACARVCPYAAIIFPKYDKSPINGDEVVEAEWKKSHAASAASLKDRLSGNIYQLLRNRNNRAASVQSLSDLEKLKDSFDIPEDLFESHS
ncbi:MAG: ferredoxin family protein [Phycisphaerae bacterium]|nr:ferredoxin family protein [Phycisphaerae bacterium]